jgi:ribosomal-protein-alanine acetyltransferase
MRGLRGLSNSARSILGSESLSDKGVEYAQSEFDALSVFDCGPVYGLDRRCLLSPWSYDGFHNELGSEYCFCWGRRSSSDGIDAFALSHVILDEAHLLKFGVAPEVRRQGVGERLMRYCIDEFRQMAVRQVVLEVRRSNRPARTFYHKIGFVAISVRRGYYGPEDGHPQESEDAILYSLTL